MDLRQMVEFLTISELGNMSRAADYLKVSQPALSKSMNRIEEELGISVFDRNGRRISVNEAGTRFRASCEKILGEWNLCRTDLAAMKHGNSNTIRIGSFGPCDAIMRSIAGFRGDGMDAEFQICATVDLEKQIDIKQYDVLVYPADAKYDFFQGYPFYQEEFLLAVHYSNPLAEEAVITPRMLENQSLIWLSGSGEGADYPKRICEAMLLPIRTAAVVDSREIQRKLVEEGIGSALLPKGASQLYSGCRLIRLIPVLDRRFTRQMMICFRKEKHLSETARKYRDYLIKMFDIPQEV